MQHARDGFLTVASMPVELRRLHPQGTDVPPEDLVGHLDLASRAPAERPYLVLNMISTLDGKAAIEGRTLGMGNEADRVIFHTLRTQPDAIMAGAGTVRDERYGRPIRSEHLRAMREGGGLAPEPPIVVVSGSLDLPPDLPLLAEPEGHVIVITASEEELEGHRARVDYVRTGYDLRLGLAVLRERHGIRSLVCEGGPTLNGHLFAAGLVDELFLTLASKVAGGTGEPTIVAGRPLPAPAGGELIWLCEHGGDLFGRWRIRAPGRP